MTMTTRSDGYPVVIVSRGFFAKLHWRLRARLPVWVIYNQTTKEYPGVWIARMSISLPAPRVTRFVIAHDSLEELRGILPPGLTRLVRHPSDPPEVVETWF